MRGLWHLLHPGSNPICRRSDRIEAAVLAACCAAMLIAMAVGVSVGAQAAARSERRASAARTSTQPHQVVLLADAPATSRLGTDPAVAADDQPVLARWHTAAGVRTGTVRVGAGTPAGTRVTIWFNAHGQQSTPPESRLGTVLDGIGPGLAVTLETAGGALVAVLLTHVLLNRRRFKDWEREWLRVEPLWTRRPRRNPPA